MLAFRFVVYAVSAAVLLVLAALAFRWARHNDAFLATLLVLVGMYFSHGVAEAVIACRTRRG